MTVTDVRELDLMWFDLKCPQCGFEWEWFAEMKLIENGATASLDDKHATCWKCKRRLQKGDKFDFCKDDDDGHEVTRVTYLIP